MVVTTQPAGSLALPQEALRQLLADCPAVQSFLSVANATEALEHIYQEGLPRPENGETYSGEELERYRAYVLIWTGEDQGYTIRRTAQGVTQEFDDEGTLIVSLRQTVPEELALDAAEVDIRFRNLVGALAEEMQQRSGSPGFLDFTEATFSGPSRTDEDEINELGDEQFYRIEVSWSTIDQ